jgi:hypothetical protein
VVQHDYLALLVLVGVELRQELVSLNASAGEVQGLADVKLVVFLGVTQVHQKEIRLNADWELLSADGDRGEVGGLAAGVLFRLVPVVDRLRLLLLVDQLPEGRRLDPAEELALLLRGLLVACVDWKVLMNSTSLTVVPILPASFDSTWSYLLVLWTLTSRTEGFPGW